MSIHAVHDGGGTATTRPAQEPLPPPTVESLRAADARTANDIVADMDEPAIADLQEEVSQLSVSDRQQLLNELAARLDAPSLERMHPVFGQDAVATAVETRSSVEVRDAYQARTADSSDAGSSSPLSSEEAQEQIEAAQQDFEREGLTHDVLGAPHVIGRLAEEHADEPAYLAELIRLADEQGALFITVNEGLDRESIANAIGAAVERGILTEGRIRQEAATSDQWLDVANRIGLETVGRTDASDGVHSELDTLIDDYADARKEVEELNEELETFLLRAGPLTDEQRAAFIESFRTRDDNAGIYAAEVEAGQALADYVSSNREAVLEAAIRDPRIAGQVVDMLGNLADSGHGELALQLLGEIMAVPDSALGQAFESHADTLQGDLFEKVAGAATVEVAERNGDDLQAAVAEMQELFAPFKDVHGLHSSVSGGISSFQEGMALMEEVANGDFDALQRLAEKYEDASPFARAISAASVVLGAVKAADSASEGDYLEAVQGFASAGEKGLNLLAGAVQSMTATGRLAQYSDDAARFATFASRMAPALGALASATSMVINARKAGEDANVGYAIAAIGDSLSMLGSAVSAIPGGQPAGIMVNAIGSIISAIGGFVGDAIDQHRDREQLREHLEAAGVDPTVIDMMLYSGKAAHEAMEALGMDAESFQALVSAHPDVAASPGHLGVFVELVEAAGIPGERVGEFADALAADDPNFAWEIFGLQSFLPSHGSDREAAWRDQLEIRFGQALELAESVSPELFGDVAQQQENARSDYERDGYSASFPEMAIGNHLKDNTDPAYRAEMIRQLDDDGRLEAWVDFVAGYGDQWRDAATGSLDAAADAGVIDRATADALKARFD